MVSRRIIERLADEIEMAGNAGLIPRENAVEIAEALRGQSSRVRVRLTVPDRISCTLKTELTDLRFARCTNCGRVYDLQQNPSTLENSGCPSCGGSVVPAPVWAVSARRMGSQQKPPIYPSSGVPIVRSLKDYARVHRLDRIRRVFISDYSRPIASLNLEVSRQQFTQIINEVDLTIRLGSFEHMLAMAPTESVTKPVSVTAFAYNEEECLSVKPTVVEQLRGVEEILFCRRLEVLQATVAYKAGNPRLSGRDRVVFLDYERNTSTGIPEYRLYVRHITTCGLVVRVNANIIREAAEVAGSSGARDPLWVGLHTLSHAFLVRLPQATGLEGSDFCEALRTVADEKGCCEFAVYDNSKGGLGGIEGVVDEQSKSLHPNYELHILSVATCPLDCIKACKACLFTDSCYMLNWGLNRRILLHLGWVQ